MCVPRLLFSSQEQSRREKQKKTDGDRKAVISPTGVGDAEEEWGGEEGTREVREQRRRGGGFLFFWFSLVFSGFLLA